MTGDELYVRARVISSRLHPNPFAEGDLETAWVQLVLGPAVAIARELTRSGTQYLGGPDRHGRATSDGGNENPSC